MLRNIKKKKRMAPILSPEQVSAEKLTSEDWACHSVRELSKYLKTALFLKSNTNSKAAHKAIMEWDLVAMKKHITIAIVKPTWWSSSF